MTLTEHRADARHGLAIIAVNMAGKYPALKIAIESALMGHIGDPARVELSGTLAEGLWLKPAKAPAGVTTKWQGAKSIYLTFGPKKYRAPLTRRKPVEVRAIASAEGIRISGPPQEWMDGKKAFAADAKPEPPRAPNVVRLSSHPDLGHLPPRPPVAAAPKAEAAAPVLADIAAEISDLAERLRQARDRLEAITGLKFRFTRDLGLVLSQDP